ncbi:TadB Flp pilus assembly protein TadB [Candidatus Nanopelagicaceae bacterium]
MNLQIGVPCFIALIAFFIADENSHLVRIIFNSSLKIGNRKSVENRLAQLGKSKTADFENFRISQLAYIVAGVCLATVALILTLIGFGLYLLLITSIPLLTLVITERNLSKRVLTRKKEIEGEFPAIVEMLTLAVGAGESTASALKRITQRAHGHLSLELARVVREVEGGTPFASSLDQMSKRLNSDALRRFVDSLIISISRGTPLVETLTHSANESRNQERVRLLTAAGKSEISMMIPVVFLILPISILFALFPSLTNLNLFSN